MSTFSSLLKPVSIDPYNSKANQVLKKTESPKSQDAKIDKSAKDFESLLLGSWLQQAQESFATGIEKTVDWYLANRAWCADITTKRYSRERLGRT